MRRLLLAAIAAACALKTPSAPQTKPLLKLLASLRAFWLQHSGCGVTLSSSGDVAFREKSITLCFQRE